MASNVTKVAVFLARKVHTDPWHLGTCSMSIFGDGGHDRCSMGPKRLLERVFFCLKSAFLRGFNGTFLAFNVTKVAVISGWKGLGGSMGPGGHFQCLYLVTGALTDINGSETVA